MAESASTCCYGRHLSVADQGVREATLQQLDAEEHLGSDLERIRAQTLNPLGQSTQTRFDSRGNAQATMLQGQRLPMERNRRLCKPQLSRG